MGIVVNHCLEVSLTEMLEHLDIETTISPGIPVLAGGPVATDHGFVLHRGSAEWEGSQPVTDTVCLTGSQDLLRAIAAGEGPDAISWHWAMRAGFRAIGIRNGREQLAHRARR